jgi:hypothetical protein
MTTEWDRTVFACDLADLEIEEAIRSLERIAEGSTLKNSTRVSVNLAIAALRADRAPKTPEDPFGSAEESRTVYRLGRRSPDV